ncbi:hypothetical protein AB0N65_19775 [Paenarthrobacter sp. NPDC089322]|uniref:hypothetical protein n=1 Tax=Paenarthrobacter sp. NPDC089322 TaxID=3155065 RepID=UPI003425B19E
MQNHVMFPDFSAFQIDIPHGHWPHESSWPGGTYPDPDLYSAFWPDMRARAVPEAVVEGSDEGSDDNAGSAGSGGGGAAP